MTQLTKQDYSFLLRRLHSLTGIVPIGGFLLFHFYENASARRSPEAFNETVHTISQMPYLLVLEWGFLLLPILFHSIYGLYITAESRPNIVTYSNGRNLAYFFQRVTGIIGFFYLGYHIISTRMWALFIKGSEITYQDMQDKFTSPLAIVIYIIGILSLTYHFANGIWSFSITWGLVKSDQGQKRLAVATMGLFVVLAVVGIDIMTAFMFKESILKSTIGL